MDEQYRAAAASPTPEKSPHAGDLASKPPQIEPCVKNPRRVAAGRRNRARRGELTPEGRERLRQAALRSRPWEYSRPISPEGKDVSQELRELELMLITPAVQLRRSVKELMASC